MKKLKLHYHQSGYLKLGKDSSEKKTKGLLPSLFFFCFWVGNLLVTFFILIKKTFQKIKQYWPTLTKHILTLRQMKDLGLFGLILLLAFGGYFALNLLAKGLELKTNVLNSALYGSRYLDQAKNAVAVQDLQTASNKFLLAYDNFYKSSEELKSAQDLFSQLVNVIPSKQKADHFLKAALLISEAGSQSVELYQILEPIKVTPTGLSTPGSMADILNTASDNLKNIRLELAAANSELKFLKIEDLPSGYRETFVKAKNQAEILQTSFNTFGDFFSLFKSLISGEKKLLILFENNNELRPTGGFLGTFGNATVKDGQISKLNISSIYDLDGQLHEKIIPPSPISYVNNRWFLRDSNWFADFPDSARKITSFYEKDGGETPDVIIIMTPQFITDSLKVTGPISLPSYQAMLDENNFVELIQAISTLSNGSPTNKPKQVLADFVPVFLQKFQNLPKEQWQVILEILQKNLQNKQIAIFSRDAVVENQIKNFNWAGEVKITDRDYLSVVSANLSGTKTDLYIDQKLSLETSVDSDGSITDQLIITRTNKLPNLRETNNDSFIRIFVPKGSVLISNSGFDFKNLQPEKNSDYLIDSDAFDWEKNSVRDVVSGTIIGQEAGKTFFGNWLSLTGGETKTVKLVYRLPFKLAQTDHYSLLLQKQMGTLNQDFTHIFNFAGRNLQWKNFDIQSINSGKLSSAFALDKDYFLGLVLTKP